MAPIIPRFHLFEIDDQPWFPAFLRARVQDILRETWTWTPKFLQTSTTLSPAQRAARLLYRHLGTSLGTYTFIDFCAGSGGPTPTIERTINRRLRTESKPEVDFVLTDLFPNPEAWSRATAKSDHIRFESDPVDASAVDQKLLARLTQPRALLSKGAKGSVSERKKVFRLFNLAFHHFDDPLASDILENTLETSDGFAIFELQARDVYSIFAPLLLAPALFLAAPYFAWRWRSWVVLVFTYLIPVLPFVLVFDGWVSSLRTRTPEEVEQLMRSCGADSSDWEIKSGRECHLWPVGYMNWIIATKKTARL